MEYLETIEELKPLYGPASEGAQRKVSDHLTPLCARWISEAKFCVMATVNWKLLTQVQEAIMVLWLEFIIAKP